MYRYLLVVCTLIFMISFSFAEDDDEKANLKKVEVELEAPSPEDIAASRPSNVNIEDIEALLALQGLEIQRDNELVQALESSKHRTSLGTLGHQTKNFPGEALVFYAAIGASMMRQANTDSLYKEGRADPRWMENLLHEMTSPVGIFSFFAFVVASGQTNFLYSKWLSHGFGPFKKGPLKGMHIIQKPWMTPYAVGNRLNSLRSQALFGGGRIDMWKYRGLRAGMKFFAGLGGTLGMAAGMMASNIVHEVDYTLSHNLNYRRCYKAAMKDKADAALACDLFYDQSLHTIKTWLPGLFSLVTASFISHFLVRNTYRVGAFGVHSAYRAGASGVLHIQNSRFLTGAVVRTSSRISIAALVRGASWAASFVPIGWGVQGVRWGAKGVGMGAKLVFQFVKKQLYPNSRFFRFINLYAFMEIDNLVTRGWYDKLITEGMNARAVSGSIRDFSEYHNVDNTTPLLLCEEADKLSCQYHESVFYAYKTANYFNLWRQYKMQIAMQAYGNWFQYVSNALGSVEQSYNTYKEFFQAKEDNSSAFNQIAYFNRHTVKENGQFVPLSENEYVQTVFKTMLANIDEYLTQKKIPEPINLDLNVVSLSPSYFLKPEEKLNIKNEGRLFVLRALFSAVDPNVSIQSFYGDDWNKALEQERHKIINNSTANPNRVLNRYFDELERLLQASIEATKHLVDPNDILKYYFSEVSALLEQTQKSIADSVIKSDSVAITQHFNFMKTTVANEQKRFTEPLNADTNLTDYFKGWNLPIQSAKQTILQDNELLDRVEVEARAEDHLRKRVLAAGVEYLNKIIESEIQVSYYVSMGVHGQYPIGEELRKSWEELPSKVRSVFYRLGANNIFAQLYKEAFEIKPRPKGMYIVDLLNDNYEKRAEQNHINYHPGRLQFLRTPHIIDFIVASALCGPDLSKEQSEELLATTKNILKIEKAVDRVSAFKDTFAEKNIDDIIDSVSVFDRVAYGTSYAFYPPRIPGIVDEHTRNVICRGSYRLDHSPVIENIYDSRFPVEEGERKILISWPIEIAFVHYSDTQYSNLFHLVLDRIGEENGISSVEEFEDWWNKQVMPYVNLFILAAEREYKGVVKDNFMFPLFQDQTENVTMRAKLISNASDQYQSTLDQMSQLSKDWFASEKIANNRYHDRLGRRVKQYSFALPEGIFQNMYFELLYWSDVILHFVQKREKGTSDMASLKEALSKFAAAFNSPDCLNAMSCQEWVKQFLEPGNLKRQVDLLNHIGAAEDMLGLPMTALLGDADPGSVQTNNNLSVEEMERLVNNSIGSHATPVELASWKTPPVPDQLINYSIIRFKQIFEEAQQYAHHIGYLSQNPEVQATIKAPGGKKY